MPTLLSALQSACARYASTRKSLDAAVARKDKGATALYWERLLETEAKWRPLADKFSETYAAVDAPLVEGEQVIWRRGAVGLQGILTQGGTLARVATKRGVFSEYAGNLIPLSSVH